MHFFSTVLALSAVPAAVLGAIQMITVGDGGKLAFNPDTIQAQIGDEIQFMFKAKNHSVTQNSFKDPCIPATFNGSAGVDSGFVAISNATQQNGTLPVWSFKIKATTPLWFHCSQIKPKSHCGQGMVFSINPTADKSHQAYVANALVFGQSNGTSSSSTASDAANNTAGSSTASGDAASNATSSTGGDATTGSTDAAGASANSATPSSADAASSAAAASATGSGVAAAANVPSASGTAAADHSSSKHSGASKRAALTQGAGLLTFVAVVGAMLP